MKHISINVMSEKSVLKAIKQIQDYKVQFNQKCSTFVERLAELGLQTAQQSASMSPLGNTVAFHVDNHDMFDSYIAMLIGQGGTHQTDGYPPANTLLLIEFGAGIVLNSVANPEAGQFGMGVGTFPDEKHAFDPEGWYYPDESGVWHHTYGVKAEMPMYRAETGMILNIESIAREVFR